MYCLYEVSLNTLKQEVYIWQVLENSKVLLKVQNLILNDLAPFSFLIEVGFSAKQMFCWGPWSITVLNHLEIVEIGNVKSQDARFYYVNYSGGMLNMEQRNISELLSG